MNFDMKEDLETVIEYMGHRYKTFDPFIIAEKLNVQVEWRNFGNRPIGETIYYTTRNDDRAPIILLNERVRDKPERYFAMAHELGHVIEHEGLESYYEFNRRNRSRVEVEADSFAAHLLTNLFIEENDRAADNYQELVWTYGFPKLSDY